MLEERLKQHIAAVADFPNPGILFRDITPLLAQPAVFDEVIKALAAHAPTGVTAVAAIEARGFIFGAPLAQALGVAFVPIRKAGKLPRQTITAHYGLEYGSDALALHTDAVDDESIVYMVDDLIATGGTLAAAINLITQCGGKVAKIACVIELSDLRGCDNLPGVPLVSLAHY